MNESCLSLVFHFPQCGATQYRNWNYNSLTVFNGQLLGSNSDGLFLLNDGDTDDGRQIDSLVEYLTTDFGKSSDKHIRRITIGYESTGSLLVTVRCNGELKESNETLPPRIAKSQQSAFVNPPRTMLARYHSIAFENLGGCDFGLDRAECDLIITSRSGH